MSVFRQKFLFKEEEIPFQRNFCNVLLTMTMFTITMFITRVPWLLHKFMSKITKGKLSTMTSSHRNTDYAEDVTFLVRNHVSGLRPLPAASTFVHHIHLNTIGIDRHYFSWVLYPIILCPT